MTNVNENVFELGELFCGPGGWPWALQQLQ